MPLTGIASQAMEGSLVPNLGVRKGSWTQEEDNLLKQCIQELGEGKWHQVPPKAGLNRCRKSCRLRWLNYLRPNIRSGSFTEDEVDLILRLHKLLGNRWSLIAGRLPGRTSNDVKNYWNTHLQKNKAEAKRMRETAKTIIKPRPRTFSKCLHQTRESKQSTPPTQEEPVTSALVDSPEISKDDVGFMFAETLMSPDLQLAAESSALGLEELTDWSHFPDAQFHLWDLWDVEQPVTT